MLFVCAKELATEHCPRAMWDDEGRGAENCIHGVHIEDVFLVLAEERKHAFSQDGAVRLKEHEVRAVDWLIGHAVCTRECSRRAEKWKREQFVKTLLAC